MLGRGENLFCTTFFQNEVVLGKEAGAIQVPHPDAIHVLQRVRHAPWPPFARLMYPQQPSIHDTIRSNEWLCALYRYICGARKG